MYLIRVVVIKVPREQDIQDTLEKNIFGEDHSKVAPFANAGKVRILSSDCSGFYFLSPFQKFLGEEMGNFVKGLKKLPRTWL